jgi:YVTN family beta-propeller protein
MSVVYLAEHLRLKRKAALKLLAPELAEDERFRERFLRESELAASLDHPHIVPIYDAGEVEGQLYIAMRYVAGGDLRALLRNEASLEPRRALSLLAQVAEALDAAHEAGLVHRDVKPGNVMLDSGDRCYLSDFGLTKQVSSHSGFTATGQIVGTIDYVAPEVIEGKELTPGVDVYSLGCLLFECLTGQPPFHRDSEFAVLWAHVNDSPPRLTERRPELPELLDAVLAKALAKEPARRYTTAGQLVEAAEQALPAAALGLPPSRKLRMAVAAVLLGLAIAAAVALPLILTRDDGNAASAKPTIAVTKASIQRIDPQTNKLAATIAVPVTDAELVAGGGSIWGANGDGNQLFRIDPKRNTVAQTIHTIDPRGLAFGAGSLWVLDSSDGVVTRFDPATATALATIPLPPGTGPGRPVAMTASDRGVWVLWAGSGSNTVRIDPRSTAARAVTIGESTTVWSLAAAGPILWALAFDPTRTGLDVVLRVDLRRPSAPPATFATRTEFGAMAADRNGVWVTDVTGARVFHIGEKSKRIDRQVQVGGVPVGIAQGEGSVWVTNNGDGTVSRIDPKRGRVVATIPVGPNPGAVAVAEGGVWVDVHPR